MYINLLKITTARLCSSLAYMWHKTAFKTTKYKRPYIISPQGELILLDPNDAPMGVPACRKGDIVYVGVFEELEGIHGLLHISLVGADIIKSENEIEDGFILKSGGFVTREEARILFGITRTEEVRALFGNSAA